MATRKLRSVENYDVASGRGTKLQAAVGADVNVCDLDPTGAGRPARAFKVMGTGALSIQSPGWVDSAGSYITTTIPAIPAGDYWPVQVYKLIASGTTATNIVLIW